MLILAKPSERVLSIQRTRCLTNVTVLKLIVLRLGGSARSVILHSHSDLHGFVVERKLVGLLLWRRMRELLTTLSHFFSHIPGTVCIKVFLSTLLGAHI